MRIFQIFIWIFVMNWVVAPGLVLASTPGVGILSFVQGEVLLNGKRIQTGQSLQEGDKVETKKGRCTLLLGGESVFHLSESSQMIVQKFSADKGKAQTGTLDLSFGKTRALVKSRSFSPKNIQIRARGATMGVRGTEFFISAVPNQPLEVGVIAGQVAMGGMSSGASAPVMLTSNEVFKADAASAEAPKPEVKKVASSEIKEVAASVAPPQFAAATPGQFQDMKNSQGMPMGGPPLGPPPPPGFGQFGMGQFMPPPPGFGPAPPIDPNANRSGVGLTVTFSKVN